MHPTPVRVSREPPGQRWCLRDADQDLGVPLRVEEKTCIGGEVQLDLNFSNLVVFPSVLPTPVFIFAMCVETRLSDESFASCMGA